MYPHWYVLMISSQEGSCNECKTCAPDNVGEHDHTQNTIHREHPASDRRPNRRPRQAAMSTSRQVGRASGGQNLTPIGTF